MKTPPPPLPVCGAEAPGWFGKVAALGDFAQRRLPAPFVRACDAWLAAGMQSGVALLGAAWPGRYRVAPLLRFAWAPGVAGGGPAHDAPWWFGVLMPSCDRAGRYFPLLVAQSRRQPPHDRLGLEHLQRWYAHIGDAALRTLDGTTGSVDAFDAALLDAPPWPGARASGADERPGPDARDAGTPLRIASTGSTPRQPAVPNRLAGCSAWSPAPLPPQADTLSTDAFERGALPHGAEVVAGLPRGADFVRVLTAGAAC